MAGLQQLNWDSEGVGSKAAALVDLSTVAGNKISNPPWVKFQSAGWVNFPSAPTLAEQSAKGNPSVVHVIKDFGPLAPSDNYGDLGVYYWLAQVERMEPIDPNSLEGASLNAILLSLTKGESSVDPADRPQFLINCEAAAAAHEEFAPLLRTLIQAENCLFDEEGLVDANITNVMRRPTTGELAWVDPINEAIGTLTEAQEAEMDRVKELVRAEAAAA